MTERKQTKLWTMRDGTKTRICDMTDEHLKNAMNMLERIGGVKYHNVLKSAIAF